MIKKYNLQLAVFVGEKDNNWKTTNDDALKILMKIISRMFTNDDDDGDGNEDDQM